MTWYREQILLIGGAVLLVGPVVYQLLPAVACRWHHLSLLPPADRADLLLFSRKIYTAWLKWTAQEKKNLELAGFNSKQALSCYKIIQVVLVLPGVVCFLLSGYQTLYLAVTALMLIQPAGFVRYRIKKRQKAFAGTVYKIYRFIYEQTNAGISLNSALKGLPSYIRDPVVQPVLERFAVMLELTFDRERAFNILIRSFGEEETRLLCSHLRQCLNAGVTGQTMERMEALLFAKAYTRLQVETDNIRLKLFWIAASALVIVGIVFLYPLFYEMFFATQELFN